MLHGGKCREVHRLTDFGASLLDEFQNAQAKTTLSQVPRDTRESGWTCLPIGFFKLNVDASCYPGRASVGTIGVICDH